MITKKDVMEELQLLIEKYKFNIDVLSKLLDVKEEVILSQDEKKIFENSKDFSKMSNLISMIELSGKDDADFKIGAFLQVLLEYHSISAETIALMSGVSEKEVIYLVENPKLVSLESKYKISKTVMSLRFLFKELEP
ncbi:HTH domain-containing protein [Clostridium tagluense]|uniref:HTH domain-containing protein n=1 Tax=Clostridium tagluense TaxID=360422 RepID=UPI000F62873C|nr:HTH domain-containing protein [Clostridium tagluense]